MLMRLDELLGVDRAARWRIILVSGLGITIWGMASELGKVPIHEAQVNATIFGVVIFIAQVLRYCLHSQTSTANFGRAALISRRLVTTAAASVILIFLVAIPAPVLEAAVLERRLRTLTQHRALSPLQARGVADSLRIAAGGRIVLSSTTLTRVREAIKTSEPNAATANAAKALAEYNPQINPPALINPPKTDAERAFLEGDDHFYRAMANFPIQTDVQEANMAVSAYSRSIALAGSEQSLRIDALLMRATMYNNLNKPAEALADAEVAERLGSLNLSSIISIESAALVTRGTTEDLKRVIRLVTLGLQVNPPLWLLSVDPRMDAIYRAELSMRRAAAYYGLGEFTKAIEDSRQALSIAPHSVLTPYIYRTIILSYLQFGSVEDASKAALEWEKETGDPAASEVHRIVEENQTNPQRALMLLTRR